MIIYTKIDFLWAGGAKFEKKKTSKKKKNWKRYLDIARMSLKLPVIAGILQNSIEVFFVSNTQAACR